ncbi:MAG: SGNH/GDSL hydrolase family protein [Gammaproteobacteria bacterium]
MLSRLAFWLLFPLVVPQALYVRKTAPRFKGAAGSPFGRVGKGDVCSLLAIGDSLIEGVGAQTLDKALVGQTAKSIAARFSVAVDWIAFGKIGATTEKVHEVLLPKIPARQFDVILVSVGVNDVTGLTRTAKFEGNLRGLVVALHAQCPQAQIAIAGLPPMNEFPLLPRPLRWLLGWRSKTFDSIVARVAAERPLVVHIPVDIEPDPVKFAGDGYHPSESGYADFGEGISDALQPVGKNGSYVGSGNVTPIRQGL